MAPSIDGYMRDKLPESQKLQEVATEIVYQIPERASPKFKKFFF